MKNLTIVFFIAICSCVSAQTDTLSEFDSLKLRARINIEIPEGYEELDIPFFHKIPHNYALGPSDSSFQVRYWIRPLDTWVEDYNKKTDEEKANSMHPNDLCKSMIMLAVLDASNNSSMDYQVSQHPEMSKEAYNADWEAAAILETGWPQVGFKYCYIWTIHKDYTGDVYVYVLTDKKDDIIKIIGELAPLIKFEP